VTWVVPLALGGVAILVMAVFTMVSARKRHRATIAPAVVVGPRILIHDINDDRCTGCDACVSVCPTNVLDLVANKSRVLRFQDCIQCEACMFACPTEALVMFPEGSTPPPLKVPEIDENFQTAIPGQYLIGEVAGKPLVKSAANLGRAVIEHMLANGLAPAGPGGGETSVDVAIVGSGPGGLSAALTCIQKGLSYVVLEKEQMLASTIARYPKGKLVMAEPYDTENVSLLPVFDSAKEQLIPVWRELIDRVGLVLKQGESVETVTRGKDGQFEVRSTVASYKAQRVVLSIGTRGKPRTLQVPGENLPKVYSLLEDPDEWRGRSVLVVGGGDSACEAALALADAGAKVTLSYRGKGFNRAAPKNKQAIEGYAAQGRVKAKLGSQVLTFDADSVTLALADGSQKRYPNDAAFVLIGADPPVQWLEKLGIKFVERPHQYQLGKTDDIVRRFVAHAVECPEDAARAAAQVLGGSIGIEPSQAPRVAPPILPAGGYGGEPVSGPRKWLRSATSIFSRSGTNSSIMAPLPQPPAGAAAGKAQRAKKFTQPVPLSEFAKRRKSTGHSHNGRRDALSAGERTRILRMLRDEGGRMADQESESRVYIGAAPGPADYEFDFEEDSPPPVPTSVRLDVPAKPAVVVGIAQAQAARQSSRRAAERPRPTAQPFAAVRAIQPPVTAPPQPPPPPRSRQISAVAPPRHSAVVPAAFGEEPTRQVDDALLEALRNAAPAKPAPKPASAKPVAAPRSAAPIAEADWSKHALPKPSHLRATPDEPTRMTHAAPPAQLGLGSTRGRGSFESADRGDPANPADHDDMTRPSEDFASRRGKPALPSFEPFEDHRAFDEETSQANLESLAALERARAQAPSDERTRAVNIRKDPSISDIDWDLD
jgi:thioredoxin reductase/ferredoxin